MNPMGDVPVQVDVDPNEDTEWNDILRSKGILPPKPAVPDESMVEDAVSEALEQAAVDRLESASDDEINALLEDADEDERFLIAYRQARIAEAQNQSRRCRFGSVYPITKSEYEQQVTESSRSGAESTDNAGPTTVVVLMTSRAGKVGSKKMESLWPIMANKFGHVKFCSIRADMCVDGYPDEKTPTMIVYRDGNVVGTQVGTAGVGGDGLECSDLEAFLVRVGGLDGSDKTLSAGRDEDDDGDDSDRERPSRSLRFGKKQSFPDDSEDE